MNNCQHCDGDLLRHGTTHYKRDVSIVGTRYKCRDCGKTFTVRGKAIPLGDERLYFNQTGRPFVKDWRMKTTGATTQ